jgi:hypothetical protein
MRDESKLKSVSIRLDDALRERLDIAAALFAPPAGLAACISAACLKPNVTAQRDATSDRTKTAVQS